MPIIHRSRAPRESPSSIVLESPQAHLLQTGVIIFLTEMGTKNVLTDQHAKKVESDSRGPEDIAIGLVNYVLNCVTGKWSFLGTVPVCNSNKRRTGELLSILLIKFFFQLVKMMFGLVRANYSLPDWKAVTLTFFAACPIPQNQVSQKCYEPFLNFLCKNFGI